MAYILNVCVYIRLYVSIRVYTEKGCIPISLHIIYLEENGNEKNIKGFLSHIVLHASVLLSSVSYVSFKQSVQVKGSKIILLQKTEIYRKV